MSHAQALENSVSCSSQAGAAAALAIRLPEMELILCCARSESDPGARERARELLLKPIKWQVALELARAHRVLPLLYREVKAFPASLVPPEAACILKAEIGINSFRNLRLLQELFDVLRLLEQNGITGVPYKGPVLSWLLYGDAGTRQSMDLDILVPKSEVIRAGDLLRSRGYRHVFGGEEYHSGYVHDETKAVVEIHWGIAPYYLGLAPAVELWRRNASSITIAGRSMLHFSREDLLLILCVHGAKHGWSRLQWLCDVADLVREGGLDWDATFRRARELGCEGVLGLGLLLARQLLAAPVPVEKLARFRPEGRVHRLAARTVSRNFAQIAGVEGAAATLGQNDLLSLRIAERPGVRVAHLLYLIRSHLKLSDEDRETFPLPRAFFPLKYIWRPFRLVGSRLKSGHQPLGQTEPHAAEDSRNAGGTA